MHLPKVLQILLCITASISFLLDNRGQVKNVIFLYTPLQFLVLLVHVSPFFVAVAEGRLHQPSEELASAGYSAHTGLLWWFWVLQLHCRWAGCCVSSRGLASGLCVWGTFNIMFRKSQSQLFKTFQGGLCQHEVCLQTFEFFSLVSGVSSADWKPLCAHTSPEAHQCLDSKCKVTSSANRLLGTLLASTANLKCH